MMCFWCDLLYFFFFFFKQKTAYEMRISDWSSDVCSSDLPSSPRSCAFDDRFLVVLLVIPVTAARSGGGRIRGLAAACAVVARDEIGRESCRASVCQYV